MTTQFQCLVATLQHSHYHTVTRDGQAPYSLETFDSAHARARLTTIAATGLVVRDKLERKCTRSCAHTRTQELVLS
jgi:IS1 family transposase